MKEENTEPELYNNFMINQIMNLSIIYLMTVINKYMEMEDLTLERQLAMFKKHIQTMKHETHERLEKMQIIFDVHVMKTKEEIYELEKQIHHYKEEKDRLIKQINTMQDDKAKIIKSAGEDLIDLEEVMDEFNRQMN